MREGYHHGNLREALIEAALGLIAEYGPAGFSFAQAARAAGVSAAAPYRHFRDLQALIAEIARRGYERFAEDLEAAWQDGRPDPLAALSRCHAAAGPICRSPAATLRSTPPCSNPAFLCRPMPACWRSPTVPSPRCAGRPRQCAPRCPATAAPPP
jgi:AcrR family transcriptional regulator